MGILDTLKGETLKTAHARTMIHGQPGTGKTSLAATMAEVGQVLFLYVPGEEGIGSLKGIQHQDRITIHRLTGIPELREVYTDLFKGAHTFDTVVIDSVSALQTMWMKDLLGLPQDEPAREKPATDYAFWGALRDGFTDFFTFFYALADPSSVKPVHVVMTSQTKALDDMESTSKMQPDLYKGPLAAAVSRPDQIMYTHMIDDPEDFERQRHVVRIKPSSSVVAKTRCAPEVYEQLPEVMGISNRITLPKYLSILGVEGVDTKTKK